MMHLQKAKKYRFDNKRKMQGIEAFVTDRGADITMYENIISCPVQNASSGYDYEGGLIDSKILQLVEKAILLRYTKLAQVLPQQNYSSDEANNFPK